MQPISFAVLAASLYYIIPYIQSKSLPLIGIDLDFYDDYSTRAIFSLDFRAWMFLVRPDTTELLTMWKSNIGKLTTVTPVALGG
jgi:hypothetical protein